MHVSIELAYKHSVAYRGSTHWGGGGGGGAPSGKVTNARERSNRAGGGSGRGVSQGREIFQF